MTKKYELIGAAIAGAAVAVGVIAFSGSSKGSEYGSKDITDLIQPQSVSAAKKNQDVCVANKTCTAEYNPKGWNVRMGKDPETYRLIDIHKDIPGNETLVVYSSNIVLYGTQQKFEGHASVWAIKGKGKNHVYGVALFNGDSQKKLDETKVKIKFLDTTGDGRFDTKYTYTSPVSKPADVYRFIPQWVLDQVTKPSK